MNGAFLHLVLNHIPVVGMPCAFLLLLGGLICGSRDVVRAGLIALVLVAVIAIPALKTGGPAAHVLKQWPDIEWFRVRDHAIAASKAFKVTEVCGILGFLGLWFSKRQEGAPKPLIVLIILGTLFLSMWWGWVAHLGGLIRHPEISSDAKPDTGDDDSDAPSNSTPASTPTQAK